jgi:hypothetical protein
VTIAAGSSGVVLQDLIPGQLPFNQVCNLTVLLNLLDTTLVATNAIRKNNTIIN